MTPDLVRVPLRAKDGGLRAYALIDVADEANVSEYRWHLDATGYAAARMRVKNWGDGPQPTIRMHRFLCGLTKGDELEVDHINKIRLDNRRLNLRVCTHAENNQNVAGLARTSMHRGVCLCRQTGRWVASAKIGGKDYWLGRWPTESEAAEVAAAFRAAFMPFSQEATR